MPDAGCSRCKGRQPPAWGSGKTIRSRCSVLFGYIWNFGILRVVNRFTEKKISLLHFILSIIIPFYNVYFILKLNNEICKKANDMGIKAKKLTAVHVIFNLCLLGVVSSVILQKKLNKIAKVQNKTIDEELI